MLVGVGGCLANCAIVFPEVSQFNPAGQAEWAPCMFNND